MSINLEILNNLTEDEEIKKELIKLAYNSLKTNLLIVKKGIKKNDHISVHKASHTIKATMSIGLVNIYNISIKIIDNNNNKKERIILYNSLKKEILEFENWIKLKYPNLI